jgi:hypothetical protein
MTSATIRAVLNTRVVGCSTVPTIFLGLRNA